MIKKITLVLAIVAVAATSSFAQLQYGVKAGLNMANVSGDIDDTKMKLGFMIGGFANYGINEQLSVQPELMFAQAGCKMEILDEDVKFSLNYLVLPVMVKYSFGNINLQAGPQFGFLLSAESDGDDIKDNMKTMDLGLNIGAGYQMDKIGVDLRYSIGLSNVSDMEDTDVKNRGIQLQLSYKF